MEMEIDSQTEDTKKCFKFKEQLLDCLNLTYNASTSMFIFWNKFQIYAYEDLQFENYARTFLPEFQISQIVISNNYLVCLDCSGNIHVTSLKFKNPGQKRFKSTFQPREQNVLHIQQYDSDHVICLKKESDVHTLCLHKISPEFQMEKEIVLKDKDGDCPPRTDGKYLIFCHTIKEEEYISISEALQAPKVTFKDHKLILISFDKLSVYGFLYSHKAESEIKLVKLYLSPSEICDINILGTMYVENILIGLKTGTVILLSLKEDSYKTQIKHLNTALTKLIPLKNDSMIYTDSLSLWRVENILSKDEITFKQFFPKNVKDFVKFEEQIICTTYSDLIYVFPINDKISLNPENNIEYCPAEKLFDNLDYIKQVINETNKNEELLKKIHNEKNHITALTFSKRQDIMEKVIKQNVIVYNSYENAINENSETKLTEEISKYFKSDLYLLIKIHNEQCTNQVISNIFTNVKIHITIMWNNKIVKTTSLQLTESLKKLNILIPIPRTLHNITKLNVNTKIVSAIPGSRDEAQKLWTVIYKKQSVLNTEHFIKSHIETSKCLCLKEPEESLQSLICKIAHIQHGDVFRFIDLSTVHNKSNSTMYVQLPSNYRDTMTCEDFYKRHFNLEKARYMFDKFSNEAFLKGRNSIFFEVGDEKVKLEIINEIIHPVLKVSSSNINVAFAMRNFCANLVYNEFKNMTPGKVLVSNALYTTAENIQKAIKAAILKDSQSELVLLTELFQKNVIGALPL